jgi:cytochrome c
MKTLTALSVLLVGGGLLGSAGAALAQDAAAGEKVFNQCRACHAVDQEQNRVGPHLIGVFGREAGSLESFDRYSDAMKNADITWNEETIKEYLKDPRGYIPGNIMAFPGVKNEEDLDNLIAYLKEATAKGS